MEKVNWVIMKSAPASTCGRNYVNIFLIFKYKFLTFSFKYSKSFDLDGASGCVSGYPATPIFMESVD